jgi:arylsulfatase A-like enzyme
MQRRHLIQGSLAAAAPAAIPPNILFIISDDHSAAYLGCYGDPHIRTPHLDRLAASGIRFDRAYVVSPQCSPSRTALMSGRTPHAVGGSRLHATYRPELPGVVDALQSRGYFTGAFRKVHLGAAFEKRFDHYGGLAEFFGKSPASRPFFLWAGFTEPHRPYGPKTAPRLHDPAKVRVPPFLPDTAAVREDLAFYYDSIAKLDAQCGELLDLLERKGLSGNTAVFFMGDNGMPYPRAKATLYQPGICVPLLVRWPGRVKPGAVSRELVSSLDLPATWLDIAGAKPLSAMEGQSLLPVMDGRPHPAREFVFTERNWHDTWDPMRGVISQRYSLIVNYRPEVSYRGSLDHVNGPEWNNQAGFRVWNSIAAEHKAGRLRPELSRSLFGKPRSLYELYDLQNDPAELRNLAEDPAHQETLARMRAALTRWMNETNDFLPPPNALPPLAGNDTRELPLRIWMDGYLP